MKNNLPRNKTTIACFSVALALILTLLAMYVWQFYLLFGYRKGTVSMDDLNQSDYILKIITIVFEIVIIASSISFLLWFRRAYYNLIQINHFAAGYSDGWAIGWWFIPLANYYMPYKTMQEIWRGNIEACGPNTNIKYPAAMLGIWWIAYLIRSVASMSVYFLASGGPNNFTLLREIAIVSEVSGVISIIMLLSLLIKFQKLENDVNAALQLAPDSIFATYIPTYNNAPDGN